MFLTHRRMKPTLTITAAASMIGAGLLLTYADAAKADDHNPLAEVPFELRVDLAKAYASPVGQTVMNYVRDVKPNVDELMDGLTETLGLDPRTAVSTLVLSGEGMNEFDLQLVADLGDTTGKLEGWMLGLPGYDSDELDDDTLLHSFVLGDEGVSDRAEADEPFAVREERIQLETIGGFIANTEQLIEEADPGTDLAEARQEIVELEAEYARQELELERAMMAAGLDNDHQDREAPRVFVALPESNGRFTLIATLDDDATIEMAEAVLEGETLIDEDEVLEGDQLLRLSLAELAAHNLPRGAPGSAVLESITGLVIHLGSGDHVTAEMFMETSSPARARQVTQLLQGLVALSQFAAIEQPEMQDLANLLTDIKIEQFTGNGDDAEPGVTASFSGSQVEFERWVQWFMDNAN